MGPDAPRSGAVLTAFFQPDPSSEELFGELLREVLSVRPSENVSALESAFLFAAEKHREQKRDSGEPYVNHPIAVAIILAKQRADSVTLQTALLHDVLEDCPTTKDELRQRFGKEVAHCVDGVTKLSKVHLKDAEEREAGNLRKMLLAMVDDLRVILVKLADRLHNMRTLDSLPPERQHKIARETLELYAPLAHRLGMGKVRGELEDLGFRFLYPDEYEEVVGVIEAKRRSGEEFLANVQQEIDGMMRAESIPARVESRIKRPYSVYLKLKRQKIEIEGVFDLLGVRIVTDSTKHCYAALGFIHNRWKPVPGRIKDFIAIPRPNGYKSLHTSVIAPGAQTFEVQIRTEEMHRIAEDGIAAHWKYKEGGGSASEEDRMAWLRQLIELQQDSGDSRELVADLKVDLYPEEVYAFTPAGKVISLPKGATPIDFAYAVHTDVGHTCVGAKINGALAPLRYELKNGDVVEILTQPSHKPSRDWLTLVKTSKARSKIRQLLNISARAEAVAVGEKIFEKECRRRSISPKKIDSQELESIASDFGIARSEDVFAAIGFGKLSPRAVLNRLFPEPPADEQEPPPAPRPGMPGDDLTVYVHGMDDLLVQRAKCCSPISGEEIVGYVTRGKGITVHSRLCPNVQAGVYEPERRIDVGWERTASRNFPVKIIIYTNDRPGMLNQFTSIIATEGCNISTLEARQDVSRASDSAIVDVTLLVADARQLQKIMGNIRRVSGVRDVERVNPA